jgi:hypothetical protein
MTLQQIQMLVRYAEDEYNIWIEPLSYEPIETPSALGQLLESLELIKRKTLFLVILLINIQEKTREL